MDTAGLLRATGEHHPFLQVFAVRTEGGSRPLPARQIENIQIPLLPDLIMGDAHKLYIGGAGPIIGSGFEVSRAPFPFQEAFTVLSPVPTFAPLAVSFSVLFFLPRAG